MISKKLLEYEFKIHSLESSKKDTEILVDQTRRQLTYEVEQRDKTISELKLDNMMMESKYKNIIAEKDCYIENQAKQLNQLHIMITKLTEQTSVLSNSYSTDPNTNCL